MSDSKTSISAQSLRILAVLAVAAAAAVIAWLVTSRGADRQSSPTTARTSASGPLTSGRKTVRVTAQGLETLAGVLKQPLYWAGGRSGYSYELTREADGRMYIRYLPAGTAVGAKKPLLTIGTYPVAGAFSITQSAAAKDGATPLTIGGGGVAFYGKSAPGNVYLAFPGSDFQIEVYDPSPAAAHELVESGAVTAVPGLSASGAGAESARGYSLAGLESLAGQVGHPVYWAGPRPKTVYEVTRTAEGRIFVRYLPAGVLPGVNSLYLTIGTYPATNAFAATRALAGAAGTVRMEVGSSAVAFYGRSRPTNIYEAFPGVDYQVETFDPSVVEGRQLVTSGRIVPIS